MTYICDICGYGAKSKAGLKIHKKRMHKQAPTNESNNFPFNIPPNISLFAKEEVGKMIKEELTNTVPTLMKELERRLGEDRRDRGDLLSTLTTLAILFKGTSPDFSALTQMGSAIRAVLTPVVGAWSAGVAIGLQSIGYAQKMTSGAMSPQQASEELARGAAEILTKVFPGKSEASK